MGKGEKPCRLKSNVSVKSVETWQLRCSPLYARRTPLVSTLLCLAVSFQVNAIQTVAHFVGAILIANFISEEWDYRYLWQVQQYHRVLLFPALRPKAP